MNIIQTSRRLQGEQKSRFVAGGIIVLLVVGLLALAGIWAAGLMPLRLAPEAIVPGIDADAARYAAMGQYFARRGAEADSARWTAVGRSYASSPAALGRSYVPSSPAAGSAALPYTDVSAFYAERMRAEAHASAALAANPELVAARRAYRPANELALNPELGAARRYGAQGQQYTDVSKFYVERLRAQIKANAANAELGVAQKYGPERQQHSDVYRYYVERFNARAGANAELDADAEMVPTGTSCSVEGFAAAATGGMDFWLSEHAC